jgi:hypothetical protein
VTVKGVDFWQKRADEARLAAASATHPALKHELLQVAADFEKRARQGKCAAVKSGSRPTQD